MILNASNLNAYFNSRPCERGFNARMRSVIHKNYFNSRPCERGFRYAIAFRLNVSFQFTPLREGLHRSTGMLHPAPISIHAPARGASWDWHIGNTVFRQFQFTPLREGLRTKEVTSNYLILFQFTPLREGLRDGAECYPDAGAISIHAPARGASAKNTNFSIRLLLFFIH